MFGGHGCALNQGQQIALHAFATDICSTGIGARTDLVDLVKKHDSALLHSRQSGFGDGLIVEQLVRLFSEQHIIAGRHGHLFAAGSAPHGFPEEIAKVHHSHLTAGLSGKIQDRQGVRCIGDLKFDHRVIQLTIAQFLAEHFAGCVAGICSGNGFNHTFFGGFFRARAKEAAEERVIEAITGTDARDATREMFRKKLRNGELDDTMIELEIADTSNPLSVLDLPGQPGSQMGMMNLGDLFGKAMGGRTSRKKMTVAASYDVLLGEEADKLLDDEAVTKAALTAVEQSGIVFLDEIDKVCARADARGADVSREGVQRDLLPLIEGTTVSTKHGPVKTDHILFIASGAFHVAKPSDLLPELQGRLPIRVELRNLTEEDFIRILSETENALTLQYSALMSTEDVSVSFSEDGIKALAQAAAEVNRSVENIGARRLYTVIERVFEELSFAAPDQAGSQIVIDKAYVDKHLDSLLQSTDLSRYVL